MEEPPPEAAAASDPQSPDAEAGNTDKSRISDRSLLNGVSEAPASTTTDTITKKPVSDSTNNNNSTTKNITETKVSCIDDKPGSETQVQNASASTSTPIEPVNDGTENSIELVKSTTTSEAIVSRIDEKIGSKTQVQDAPASISTEQLPKDPVRVSTEHVQLEKNSTTTKNITEAVVSCINEKILSETQVQNASASTSTPTKLGTPTEPVNNSTEHSQHLENSTTTKNKPEAIVRCIDVKIGSETQVQKSPGSSTTDQLPTEPVSESTEHIQLENSTTTTNKTEVIVSCIDKKIGLKTPVPNARKTETMEVEVPPMACSTDSSLLNQFLMRKSSASANPDTIEIKKNVDIFVADSGPRWYPVSGPIVTDRLVTENLLKAFNFLPVDGRPEPDESTEAFQERKIREFIGCDINDQLYSNLSEVCGVHHLKTDRELSMQSNVPLLHYHSVDLEAQVEYSAKHETTNLCIVKKHKMRQERDETRRFSKRLKYRGLRLMPLYQQKRRRLEAPVPAVPTEEEQLEPGTDLLFHIRIYRPFLYNMNQKIMSGAMAPCRHSVFARDAMVCGRSPLHALRGHCVCPNDGDSRHDLSQRDEGPRASAKELFPSGFMFINNVFYVDDRPGCKDLSEGIRQWAARRGIGTFPKRSMECRIQDIPLRLGHPEVYVHQGNCEHVFTISDVRLVNATDPLNVSHYPCHTVMSQNQSVYCTTCAEFCAKWIVVGSKKVPFDPAFFCDTCLKQYLYVGGRKIEDFKLYAYNGNTMSVAKPQS